MLNNFTDNLWHFVGIASDPNKAQEKEESLGRKILKGTIFLGIPTLIFILLSLYSEKIQADYFRTAEFKGRVIEAKDVGKQPYFRVLQNNKKERISLIGFGFEFRSTVAVGDSVECIAGDSLIYIYRGDSTIVMYKTPPQ